MKNNLYIMSALVLTSGLFATQFAFAANDCRGMGILTEGSKKSNVLVIARYTKTLSEWGVDLQQDQVEVFIQRTDKALKGTTTPAQDDMMTKALNGKTKLGAKIGPTNYEYAFSSRGSATRNSYSSGVVNILANDQLILRQVFKDVNGTEESKGALTMSSGKNSIKAIGLICGK